MQKMSFTLLWIDWLQLKFKHHAKLCILRTVNGFRNIQNQSFRSKLLWTQANLRNPQQNLWNPQQKLRNPEQFVEFINK